MPESYSDVVSITNSATADAKSTGSAIDIQPNSTITELKVTSLTVGNTYAVEISYPKGPSPLKFLVPTAGGPATNGQGIYPTKPIKVRIPVMGVSRITIYTYADTPSATCQVGIKWEEGISNQITYGDFVTASVGTSETDCGDIPVPSGAKIKQITYASRLSIGLITLIRLDCSGIKTPQKYVPTGTLYDAVGTQVQDNAGGIMKAEAIECEVTVPSSANLMSVYATSQTASNTSAIGLVWV